MTDPAPQPQHAPRPRRDWVTPVLLTLSLHLLALTLFVNHRLFGMLEQPKVGGITLQIAELTGDDPAETEQADDPGAAPGEPAEKPAPTVTEMLRADTPPAPLPAREPTREPRPAEPAEQAPDPRSLSERLAMMRPEGGGATEAALVAGGGAHGLRGQGRRGEGLRRHGGSAETESAMELGLAWLARVQDSDGRWDSDGFMVHYLPNANAYERAAEGIGLQRNDVGISGLCLLAFTGAGYVHTGGKYADTVRRASSFLLANQRVEDGGFGLERDAQRPDMYGHALSLLALADLYLQSADHSLRTPIRRGLLYLLEMQGPGGGWDYSQRWPTRRDSFAHSTRDDLSISGWAIMAMLASRECGFEIPQEPLEQAAAYLRRATTAQGDGVYANTGVRAGDRGMAMMSVSNLCRRLMGEPADSPTQQHQRERIARSPPDWSRSGELMGSNEYMWYYGSLATLIGRDSPGGMERWQEWNGALKRTLLPNQVPEGPRKGSFDPVGHWARNGGGRLYMTAICVLSLQIYYRYEPEYLRTRAADLRHLWPTD